MGTSKFTDRGQVSGCMITKFNAMPLSIKLLAAFMLWPSSTSNNNYYCRISWT